MAKLERIYTVPLGDAYEAVRQKRVPRAVKLLRAFIIRHMKADGEKVVLSGPLNSHLWARSIQKPPRRVKVRLVKDEGVIRAFLADEKPEEPKKKAVAPKKEEPKAAEKKAEPKPEKPPEKHKAPEKKPEAKEHKAAPARHEKK
ncbi:MAG: 50S ribosomal protein L31e [Candidatus Micrarchaeota archaeon]